MKLECPIIYIHKGGPKYLEISIKQSLQNSNDIILVGDEKNLDIAKKYNIKHALFDNYNTNDFEKYYIHDTVQNANYGFELICFQRWFVLLEVMKNHNIDKCLYLDSDILYYGNVKLEFQRISKYGNFDLAYPNSSGHSTYIFSQNALQKFCDYMMKSYKDKKLFEELSTYASGRNLKRSDMSIFQLYLRKFPERIFDLKDEHNDGIVYDGFINYSEGYKTIFGKKYFTIQENKAYIYKKGKKIETKTLHFQMHMKSYMGIVYRKQVGLFRFYLFFNYIIEWLYWRVPLIRGLRTKWKNFSLFK